MKFIIFVIDDGSNTGSAAEMQAIDSFNEKLAANGQWIHAAGIGDAKTSLRIDNRAGIGLVDSGSLVTSAKNYSGFWLINASNAQMAQQLALEGSFACNREVELRPYLGN